MTWVGQQELLILEGEQVSLVSEVRGGRNRSGPVSGWEATCTEEATSPQGWCWICRPARLERCCICRLRAQSRLAGRLRFGNWVCETFHAASQLLHGQGWVEEKESRKALPFLGWFEFLIPSCDNLVNDLGHSVFLCDEPAWAEERGITREAVWCGQGVWIEGPELWCLSGYLTSLEAALVSAAIPWKWSLGFPLSVTLRAEGQLSCDLALQSVAPLSPMSSPHPRGQVLCQLVAVSKPASAGQPDLFLFALWQAGALLSIPC